MAYIYHHSDSTVFNMAKLSVESTKQRNLIMKIAWSIRLFTFRLSNWKLLFHPKCLPRENWEKKICAHALTKDVIEKHAWNYGTCDSNWRFDLTNKDRKRNNRLDSMKAESTHAHTHHTIQRNKRRHRKWHCAQLSNSCYWFLAIYFPFVKYTPNRTTRENYVTALTIIIDEWYIFPYYMSSEGEIEWEWESKNNEEKSRHQQK